MGTSGFNPSLRRKVIQLGKVYIPPNYMIAKIWRKPDYRKDIAYSCNIHVATLASLTEQQTNRIISVSKVKPLVKYPLKLWRNAGVTTSYFDIEKVVAAFDYPLKQKCVLTIRPTLDSNGHSMLMNIGYFLWQVARAYQDIVYVSPQKYGIWGHGLNDLYFETIILKKISPKNYYGVVDFGS
jgi:hypothetical protein